MKPLSHGGDITQAMQLAQQLGLAPGERADWLDLSAAINPRPYPVGKFDASIWHELPSMAAYNQLIDAACGYYDAPSPELILAAAGSTPLIVTLPFLFDHSSLSIVGPTYSDHQRSWTLAGFINQPIKTPKHNKARILVVTNPNNPTGVAYPFDEMAALAQIQTRKEGWLIVDEAFCDLVPECSAVSLIGRYNVIVLKSFGKFFGLAGLRLGFLLGAREIVEQMRARLGSWPVSGPALNLATAALLDGKWQGEARRFLASQTEAVLALLKRSDLRVLGGTDLFTLVKHKPEVPLLESLLAAKIYCRHFDEMPSRLRIGLPADPTGLTRLSQALSCF